MNKKSQSQQSDSIAFNESTHEESTNEVAAGDYCPGGFAIVNADTGTLKPIKRLFKIMGSCVIRFSLPVVVLW
jgi:hypothetical protein